MARWQPAPIIGGAYSDESKPWSVQDTVNYIPVRAERDGTRSMAKLRGAPGYYAFCDLGTSAPVRGARNVEGRLLAVSGTGLFLVTPDGASQYIGKIPGTGRVSMSHNQITGGNQVAISNGQSGYVYNTVDGSLVQITDEAFIGSISFDFVDSYITGVDPGRRFAFHSDLADALSYNSLDRYEAEGSPDKLIGQIVTHREWWLVGERTIEPYVDDGQATGTFQRVSGVVMERGAASPYCLSLLDNTVIWLGDDGIVYRANGYTPVRVSTYPIEADIASCNLAQCFSMVFEDQGHKIYYLTFPDGMTWGYDVSSGEWHRRQSRDLNRWRINTLTYWNGMWIAGDFSNGKLYRMDWNVQTEDGVEMERRRVTGVLHDNQNRVIVNGLELVMDTGLPVSAGSAQGNVLSIAGDLPDGTVGSPVSYQYTIKATHRPLTVSIVSGSLPTGLSIDNNVRITGTPTLEGSYSWTIRVTDSQSNHRDLPDTATYSLVIPAQQSGWRYKSIDLTDATDYSGVTYDDSSWSTGTAPFGDISGAPSEGTDANAYDSRFSTTIATGTPLNKRLWIRRKITLSAVNPDGYTLVGYFDNSYQFFVNGYLVSDGSTITHAGVTTHLDSTHFAVGSNVIAVRCDDDSATGPTDACYFDFFIKA